MKDLRRTLHNFLLYSIFIFYLVILCGILFRTRHSFRSINIVPFRTIISYLSGSDILLRAFSLSNVLGNIVLFIPLGVYFTLFSHDKKIYKNVLLVFLISLSVEVVKYLFKIGIGDIDDVILNCFGGFIGIAAYRILLLLFKDVNKVRHIIEILAPIGAMVSFLILFLYNNV